MIYSLTDSKEKKKNKVKKTGIKIKNKKYQIDSKPLYYYFTFF